MLFSLGFLLSGLGLVEGADFDDHAISGPVRIEGGNAIAFDDSASPDKRYVFGWTMAPRDKNTKAPDWSTFKVDDPLAFMDAYPTDSFTDDSSTPQPYLERNILIDRRTGKTVSLKTEEILFPYKNRGYLATQWLLSDSTPGYALIQNDARFYTANLWLITLRAGAMDVVDLVSRLNAALSPIIRDRQPIEASDLGISYQLDDPYSVAKFRFADGSAKIPFSTAIPKSPAPSVSGIVTVRLSDGKILDVACTTPKDDPFQSVPALKEADQELNAVYSALVKKLSIDKRDALKHEQIGWIKDRDESARSAESSAFGDTDPKSIRNDSLLKDTQSRIAELKKRLSGLR